MQRTIARCAGRLNPPFRFSETALRERKNLEPRDGWPGRSTLTDDFTGGEWALVEPCIAPGNGAAATGFPFKYTGRRLDPETGLYYYRARYYSSALGHVRSLWLAVFVAEIAIADGDFAGLWARRSSSCKPTPSGTATK